MSVAAEAVLILAAATGAGAGVAALARLPTRGGEIDDPERPRVKLGPPPAQLLRVERSSSGRRKRPCGAHAAAAAAGGDRRGTAGPARAAPRRRPRPPRAGAMGARALRPSGAGGRPRRRYHTRRARSCARPPGVAVNVCAGRAAQILDEVERAVVGKRDALELVLLGLLADGHVLIEDNPGLAKTLDGALVRRGHRPPLRAACSSRPT